MRVSKPPIKTLHKLIFSSLRVDLKVLGIFTLIFSNSAFLSEGLKKKKIEFFFLGYFLRWIPQENYYYAVKHTNFSANTERTEGTYQKYTSMDDRIDGFFYYTS